MRGCKDLRTNWGKEKAAGWDMRRPVTEAPKPDLCCWAAAEAAADIWAVVEAAVEDGGTGTTQLELERRPYFFRQLKSPPTPPPPPPLSTARDGPAAPSDSLLGCLNGDKLAGRFVRACWARTVRCW